VSKVWLFTLALGRCYDNNPPIVIISTDEPFIHRPGPARAISSILAALCAAPGCRAFESPFSLVLRSMSQTATAYSSVDFNHDPHCERFVV
jgi:hypothetical protein